MFVKRNWVSCKNELKMYKNELFYLLMLDRIEGV